jgi:hypothetical protein
MPNESGTQQSADVTRPVTVKSSRSSIAPGAEVSIPAIPFVVRVDEPNGSREFSGGAMLYTLSGQMYKYEHGLSASEQRAADVHAGETAAALRDLRLCLERAFRPKHRVRTGRRAADVVTVSAASARALPSAL